MDNTKHDFNIKMDQMKKLINQEDYATALIIADGIDWNRVRNVNLLTMAASVYEKNDKLPEAKEILGLALDRAPVGKRILYKLSELSARTGDIDAAEDYYYEFRQADPQDRGNYLLQYMILKARHAPYERQIKPLELYCGSDPDEKWLYELATCYDYAGRADDCVKTCDKLALLYGDSSYGIKALRLKMKYAALTPEQQNILYPRSVPVSGGSAKTEDAADESDFFSDYGIIDEPDISTVEALNGPPAEELEREDTEMAIRNSDALAAARYEDEDLYFEAYARQLELDNNAIHRQEVARRLEEQAEAETAVADEAVPDTPGTLLDEAPANDDASVSPGPDPDSASDTVLSTDDNVSGAAEIPSPARKIPDWPVVGFGAAGDTADTDSRRAQNETHPYTLPSAKEAAAQEAQTEGGDSGKHHMIVEADSVAEGVNIAVAELRNIHDRFGLDNAASKTNADKLNEIGFGEKVINMIRGKDLVVEKAGSLDRDILDGLFRFIMTDKSGAVVVLIDTPRGLDRIEELKPGFFDVCEYISASEEEEMPATAAPEHSVSQVSYDDDYDDEDDYEDENEAPARAVTMPAAARGQAKSSDEQMEIDEFAKYCAEYAAGIDCVISGKSMLALYERIEILEEDGVPLTKETAEDLIEEAADKAEKPRLSGMFHSRYDKDGRLILKESDFV